MWFLFVQRLTCVTELQLRYLVKTTIMFCRDIYTVWEGVGFALVPAPKRLVLVSDSYPNGESGTVAYSHIQKATRNTTKHGLWTLDSGLDRRLDSGINNGLDFNCYGIALTKLWLANHNLETEIGRRI